jgi:large subunit ribosomal protein L3
MKGILGEKVGMTQIFTEDRRALPVTVIKAGPCYVAQVKTADRDGYAAVQLAFGALPERKATKPQVGHAAKAGLSDSPAYLVELKTEPDGLEPGQELRADVFAAGDRVDVVGVSKGKGFAGVMKRHGFSGLGASHGTQAKHRSPGSVGACATPSRIFKGMKMAGQMGHERVTILNLEIVEADAERNLLLVKGAVPGPNGGLVMIKTAVKTPLGKGGVA